MAMDTSAASFLHKSVYPELDAVAESLLDGLNPKRLTSSGSYPVTCPKCKSNEGFYYPKSGYVNCPRKNECGESTSLWDAMLECGYSHSEIFATLCAAARVEPPKREQRNNTSNPTGGEIKLGQAILRITQMLAKRNPEPLKAFQTERGYSDEQMQTMRLGYYTTPQEVLAGLVEFGFTSDEAALHGYIERDDKDHSQIWSGMAGKVIGYWLHSDGNVRLWGRIPTGSGDKRNPKYKFSPSLKKDIPYLFNRRQQTTLVCVEGTMDAWALQLASIWGAGIGGASINSAQAVYLCGKGVTEVAHMVDGDTAGWNGAIGSIKACESVGIVTSIIPLGAGMDDADALLRSGKETRLHELVESRVNAGNYLALMLSSLYAEQPINLKAINKIHSVSEFLTETSRAIFDKYSALLGLRIDLEQEAARIYSSLIKAEMDHKNAAAVVRSRTGYCITIQKDTING